MARSLRPPARSVLRETVARGRVVRQAGWMRETQQFVVIGAGGFGREVLDLIDDAILDTRIEGPDRFEVIGVLADPAPNMEKLDPYKVEYLGTPSRLHDMPESVGYVIAIGSPSAKRRIDAEFRHRPSPVLVHPSVHSAREIEWGPGTIVCANASITNHIRLGRHVHVNLNCTIGHDAVLGDYVTLSPLVGISGNVTIEDGAFFGTGATVNPGLTIGRDAVIGASAGVIRDIPAGVTAVGVPAKPR